VVVGAVVLDLVLAIPIDRPRIFGDELIYWELGRAFAWTGHFTVRGGSSPHYGIVYPALVAIAQRLGGTQTTAYRLAQGLNSLVFALTAVPAYLIAARVLRHRNAVVVAALSVLVPSLILTSAIMTENAFYPLFVTSALLMLRALERPTVARQLWVVVASAVLYLTRAQAVVVLPAFLLAALLVAFVESRGSRSRALARVLRSYAPTIAAVVLGAAAALVARGSSTLGPYHVLIASYQPRSILHWALANVADIDLYLGVVPFAAFGVLLVRALSPAPLRVEVRRVAVLTGCLGAALLATVAVLSSSPYGLGRTHERNLFYLVPLVLVCFFAWIELGFPRPRLATTVVAVVAALLPLTLPISAVTTSSGEDGLALVPWENLDVRPRIEILGMVAAAVIAVLVFLFVRRAAALVAVCALAFVLALVVGERHAVRSLSQGRNVWQDKGWVDRAVGAGAHVVALWPTSHTGLQYWRLPGIWADEFFNRSVQDVSSADGPLPDGLPIELMRVHSGGCLSAPFPRRPQYAVVDTSQRLAAPVVAVSPSRRAVLYRLSDPPDTCFARLR